LTRRFTVRQAPSPPRRIPLDRNALQALLARGGQLGRYALRVETNRRGDTIAFLERARTR
jgi:hypothetical protein